jgi:hypothetical protein
MPTSTELANMALAHIGHASIDNIADTTEAAEICNSFYNTVRQLFLKHSKLYISRKDAELALASGETSNIYDYVYALPADCLIPIKIWQNNQSTSQIIYELGIHSSGTSIVVKSDYQDLVLIYSIDITNLDVYNTDDIIAMSYLLAKFIAEPLKKDERLTERMAAKYNTALSVSFANDRNSQSVNVLDSDQFKDVIVNSRNY